MRIYVNLNTLCFRNGRFEQVNKTSACDDIKVSKSKRQAKRRTKKKLIKVAYTLKVEYTLVVLYPSKVAEHQNKSRV